MEKHPKWKGLTPPQEEHLALIKQLPKPTNEAFTAFKDFLESQGISKQCIRNTLWLIEHLSKHSNLSNHEEVTKYINKLKKKPAYKNRFLHTYRLYLKSKNIIWSYKKFKAEKTQEIKIPTHEQINMIIANSSPLLALKLKISLETGIRPIELVNLLTKDFNFDTKTIYPNTVKSGAPRKITLSHSTAELLKAYIENQKRKPNEKIFKADQIHYGDNFREVRNKLAEKLNDPSLKAIRLYDLRHYFATMNYNKFKDLKRTQYLMGHKHSNTTDIYTHLLNLEENEQYTVATAQTITEATKLIEEGFEYITEMEGIKIFKRRK